MRQGTRDTLVGLGQSLGSGLTGALQNLVHEKVADREKKIKAKRLSDGFGIPYEAALAIADQPESIQKDLFNRLEGLTLGASGQQQRQESRDIGEQAGTEFKDTLNEQNSLEGGSRLTLMPNKERRKEIAADEKSRFKATAGIRHEILEKKRNSQNAIKDLNRLEELSSEGKLDTPGYLAFLENSGLDIAALTNPETQEYKKIQQGFLKNAKNFIGGRVTNQELMQFMDTIPNLSQSPEGRARVIKNMRNFERAEIEYYKASEEVLRENNDVPPYDFEGQVERKASKRLDALADQIKKEISKPIPKGQNKLVTALQAGSGKALGVAAKPLALAGLGAAAGSIIPGAGTAAGALGGGLLGLGGKLTGLI